MQNGAVTGWLCCGRNCSTEEHEEEEEEEEGEGEARIVIETKAKKHAERNKKEITSSKKRKTKKCYIVFVVISNSTKYSSMLLELKTKSLRVVTKNLPKKQVIIGLVYSFLSCTKHFMKYNSNRENSLTLRTLQKCSGRIQKLQGFLP